MKRQILSLATALVLTTGGAVFAQSTLNTNAPGPSKEGQPGQTNNNLQNPGSQNLKQPAATTTTTTVQGTPSTATTTSTDMNNDSTTTSTTGSMNNDSTLAPPPVDTTTTTTTTDTTPTTGTYNSNSGSTMDNTSTTSTTTTAPTSLPKTASDLPSVALMGLLALSGFFGVRAYAKRNA